MEGTETKIPAIAEEKQKGPGKKLFVKGQSGNPAGKKPGTVSITSEIKSRLLKVFPENKFAKVTGEELKQLKKQKKTYLQKTVETIFEKALVEKDGRTLNQIWAYIDGHPKATIDIGADKDSLSELTDLFRAMAKPKK